MHVGKIINRIMFAALVIMIAAFIWSYTSKNDRRIFVTVNEETETMEILK